MGGGSVDAVLSVLVGVLVFIIGKVEVGVEVKKTDTNGAVRSVS